MPRFKTVLFATDFSRGSQQAFCIACSLAPEGEGRVVLLHVLDPEHPEEPPYYVGQPTVHFPASERERGRRESAGQRVREVYVPERGLAAEYHTREGRPAEEILALADEAGCDLIVIGTHGRTGQSRLRSGSVAETVLRRARCPVLALRSPDQRSPPAGEVRAILAPVDASEHSRDAAVVAGELARRFGAREEAPGLEGQAYHCAVDGTCSI